MEPRTRIDSVTRNELLTLLPGIDVVLLTTTDVEREALYRVLRPLPGESALIEGDVNPVTCRLGHFGRYYAAHIECTMGSVGREGSMATVMRAIEAIKPKAILGIAFGVDPRQQRLGDVIVAESVIPYELARVGRRIQFRGQPLGCGAKLAHVFRTRREGWVVKRGSDEVRVSHGPLLSGEKLIADRSFRDRLRKAFPEALGGEMEAAGAYAASHNAGVEITLVKSICDWADGKKADRAQAFASDTAVSLAHYVLSKPEVLTALGACDQDLPGAPGARAFRSWLRAPASPRDRLLVGIEALPQDWASRIGEFIDAYQGTADRPSAFAVARATSRRCAGGSIASMLRRTSSSPPPRGEGSLHCSFASPSSSWSATTSP